MLDGLSLPLTCAAGDGGVRSSGGKPKRRRFHPGGAGEGKPGRVKNVNPWLMPREAEPRMVGRRGGVKGLAVVERQAPAENAPQPGRAPPSSGHRGHPPRAQLVRAERGNPVGVRPLAGKPTVRKAQFLGGNRMIEKQMPAAETQQETGTRWSAPPPVVPYNWPDTGSVPGRESVLTRSGEPVKRR